MKIIYLLFFFSVLNWHASAQLLRTSETKASQVTLSLFAPDSVLPEKSVPPLLYPPLSQRETSVFEGILLGAGIVGALYIDVSRFSDRDFFYYDRFNRNASPTRYQNRLNAIHFKEENDMRKIFQRELMSRHVRLAD